MTRRPYREHHERTRKAPARFDFVRAGLITLGVIGIICVILLIFILCRPCDGGEYYRQHGVLPQVGGLTQTKAGKHSVHLSWESVDDVAGYQVMGYDVQSGEYRTVKTVIFPRAVIYGLEEGDMHIYTVRAYGKADGVKLYGGSSDSINARTLPAENQTLDVISPTNEGFLLDWQDSAYADGYEIYADLGALFRYDLVGTVSSSDVEIDGLESATAYKLKLRAYIQLGDKKFYGRYSDPVEFMTAPDRPLGEAPDGVNEQGFSINWGDCPRVDGYEVYSVLSDSDAPQFVGKTTVSVYTVYGLAPGTEKSYTVRAFAEHERGTVYGEFSDVLSAVSLPTIVTGLDQYSSPDGEYSLSWEPSEGADGYVIYSFNTLLGEYELYADVDSISHVVEQMGDLAERYKVCAYAETGNDRYCGAFSDELTAYPYKYLRRSVKVDVSHTMLMTGPGPDYEQVIKVYRGQVYHVFSEMSGTDGNRWFRVEYTDENGERADAWICREDVSIENDLQTIEIKEFSAERLPVIYLSPSKQNLNAYCLGDTTEKEQMEAVAAILKVKLEEQFGCIVYIATPDMPLRERAYEALKLGSDVYLAIHSNATGNDSVRYGASSYYYVKSKQSEQLGLDIVAELGKVAPMPCNLNKQMYDAMSSFGGVGYAEIRDPSNLGMISVLAETEFHDNDLAAQWIIDNNEAIAQALANALGSSLGMERKTA